MTKTSRLPVIEDVASKQSQISLQVPRWPFDPEMDERSRYIAVEVRRYAWERDGGCCSFVGEDGKRCGSRYQLQFDHWRAFGKGGTHTKDNVRVLCRSHNLFEAKRVYGWEFMKRYVR